MVADALGVQLDEIRKHASSCRRRGGSNRLGVIEAGTVARLCEVHRVVNGQEVIAIEHVDRMAETSGRTGRRAAPAASTESGV